MPGRDTLALAWADSDVSEADARLADVSNGVAKLVWPRSDSEETVSEVLANMLKAGESETMTPRYGRSTSPDSGLDYNVSTAPLAIE